jgi:signal transduction histidine kinase
MPVPKRPQFEAQPSRGEGENWDRELGEFLLRLSHDLRSPLRAIRTNTELIRNDLAGPENAPFLARVNFVLAGAQSLEELADGLSGYALALRIETASFQPMQTDVLVRLALARVRDLLRETGAEVVYGALPRVFGDPDRLAQVFEILLLNALRHRGQEAPRIHVSAERQGDQWRIAVRDNGPGIEAAFLERVFRPFERLRGKDSRGPGLGLAISREIVRRHGGTMWAESEGGAGSTFFFTLPAC